jgi:hypothetical protein
MATVPPHLKRQAAAVSELLQQFCLGRCSLRCCRAHCLTETADGLMISVVAEPAAVGRVFPVSVVRQKCPLPTLCAVVRKAISESHAILSFISGTWGVHAMTLAAVDQMRQAFTDTRFVTLECLSGCCGQQAACYGRDDQKLLGHGHASSPLGASIALGAT